MNVLMSYGSIGYSCEIDELFESTTNPAGSSEDGLFSVKNTGPRDMQVGITCDIQVPGHKKTEDLTFFVSTEPLCPGETIYFAPTNNVTVWFQQMAQTGDMISSLLLPNIQIDFLGYDKTYHVTYTADGFWREGTPDD
jgi:hypothetical protein